MVEPRSEAPSESKRYGLGFWLARVEQHRDPGGLRRRRLLSEPAQPGHAADVHHHLEHVRRRVADGACARRPCGLTRRSSHVAPTGRVRRIAAVIRIPPQRGGWLEVICGPMFSGKSEEMIRRLRRAEIAGQRVVIFKPQDRRPLRRGRRRQPRGSADARRAGLLGGGARRPGSGLRGRRDRRGAVLRALRRRERRSSSPTAAPASSPPGSTRTFAGFRSGRFPSSSPTRSSWTSCRPSATAAAARRRRRSVSSTGSRRRTRARPCVVGAAEQYEARCRDCHEPGADAAALGASAAA